MRCQIGIVAMVVGLVTGVCSAGFPENDNCGQAAPIGLGETLTGSSFLATPDGGAFCGGFGSPDVWYTFTAEAATESLDLCTNTAFDTVLAVFQGSCDGDEVACSDDACGVQSAVTFSATIGETYIVLVTGFAGASGSFSLTRAGAPAPPCSIATTVVDGQTFGSTVGGEPDNSTTCGGLAPTRRWFRYLAPIDGVVTVSLCDSSFDTVLSIWDECPGEQGAELACNDDACGVQSEVVGLPVSIGLDYFIRVSGSNGAEGDFVLNLDAGPAPCACEFGGEPDDVDIQDLLEFLVLWLPTTGDMVVPGSGADFNSDGEVSVRDLLDFLECWLPTSGGAPCL